MMQASDVALPKEVVQALNGEGLEKKMKLTVMLVTSSFDGWPSMALLSVGDVVATSVTEIRWALYSPSHSVSNIKAQGKALMVTVLAGELYKVSLQTRVLLSSHAALTGDVAFAGDVDGVKRDEVPYAEVTSGIEFRPLVDGLVGTWESKVLALKDAEPV